MKLQKLIAFRTIDPENDIWSEIAFLFDNREDVKVFFDPSNEELKKLFTDEPTQEIRHFKLHYSVDIITGCSFVTDYAGSVRIAEMYNGYNILK